MSFRRFYIFYTLLAAGCIAPPWPPWLPALALRQSRAPCGSAPVPQADSCRQHSPLDFFRDSGLDNLNHYFEIPICIETIHYKPQPRPGCHGEAGSGRRHSLYRFVHTLTTAAICGQLDSPWSFKAVQTGRRFSTGFATLRPRSPCGNRACALSNAPPGTHGCGAGCKGRCVCGRGDLEK